MPERVIGKREIDRIRKVVIETWFAHIPERCMLEATLREIAWLKMRFAEHVRDPVTGRHDVEQIDKHRSRMLFGPGVYPDEPVYLADNWRDFG